VNNKKYFIGTFETEALDKETNRRLPYQVFYPTDVIKGAPQFSYRKIAENKKKVLAGIRTSFFRPYQANYGYLKEDEHIDRMPASHVNMSKMLKKMYFQNYVKPALFGKLPTLIQQMMDYVAISYEKVVISEIEESYPVVILSHGWVTNKDCMTYIAETLAMNGYIVASVQHTYFSMITLFSDGEVAGFRPNLFADHKEIMADDENIVIEDLKALNDSHEGLKGRMNFEQLGVAGYSAGASGAMWNAAHNLEIKAFLGIDASADHLEPETIRKGMATPSMFLRSEERKVFADTPQLEELQKNSPDVLVYMVPNTKHRSFGIMPYGPPQPDRLRVQTATMKVVLSFLDLYLKGKQTDLYQLPDLDENIERL
jgi:dienelactone hydrolase